MGPLVFSALSHDTIRPREIPGKTVFPSGASASGRATKSWSILDVDSNGISDDIQRRIR
jgi:hypothetical protein